MSQVIVYSTGPSCMQCTITKRQLDKVGIEFAEVDVTLDAAAYEFITEELGYSQAPVVFIEDGTDQNHWSGFRPDRLAQLAIATPHHQ